MTTSLAQQLKKLAVPESSIYVQDKKKTSLLFDPKEAASIDRETFYEIGLSGLNELKSLNKSFIEFENTLFNISSKDFERAIQTIDTNSRVNEKIKSFLLLLSPYFLLKSSHKALEWLINRFHIHKYNKDDIIKLILPYHESKIFIRCLQIMKIDNATDPWNWLEPLQKPGIPLTKPVLFNYCVSNPSFLKFISSMVLTAVEEFGDKADLLTTLFAFYCSSTVGTLEYAKNISEAHVTNILPGLLKSLSSPFDDLRAAGYMITAQLVSKAQLKKKIAQRLVEKIFAINASLHYEAVLLLHLVYQTQESLVTITEMSLANVNIHRMKTICLNMNLLVNGGSDISKFIESFMTGVLQEAQKDCESLKRFSKLPEAVISEINLNSECAKILVRCAIDSYKPNVELKTSNDSDMEIIDDDDEASDSYKIQKWYSSLLKSIEQKYPTEFDNILTEVLRNNESLSDPRRSVLNELLGFSPKLSKRMGDSFLFEKLYHQNSDMRTEAVKYLISDFQNLKNSDTKFLRESVIDRFNDDNPNVVLTILSLNVNILVDLVGEKILKDQLIQVLSNGLKNSSWWPPTCIALNYLCSLENVELDLKTCFAVLPYLFPKDERAAQITLKIIKSPLGKKILSGQDTSKINKNSNPTQISNAVFKLIENGNWLPNTSAIVKAMNLSYRGKDCTSKMIALILLSFSLQNESSPVKNLQALNEAIKFTENINMISTKDSLKISGDTISDLMETCGENCMPIQCMAFLIERIIKKTDFTGLPKPWIDFSKYSDSSAFLTQLYELIINNCNKKYKKQYSLLLLLLINSVNSTLKEKIEFLCNFIIGDNEDIVDTHNIQKTHVTQIRSIKIIQAILESSSDNLLWVLDSDIIILSIIICLSSPVSAMRTLSLSIIEILRSKIGLSAHHNAKLLDELSSRQEELQLDCEQLPLILYTLLSPEAPVRKVLTKSLQAPMKKALQFLISAIIDNETPYPIKARSLSILSQIRSSDLLETLSAVALNTLKDSSEDNIILNIHQSQFLLNVFSRIDSTTLAACILKEIVWNLILTTLRDLSMVAPTSDGSTTFVSVMMMQHIDEETFAVMPLDKAQSIISAIVDSGTFGKDPKIISGASKLMRRIELNSKHFIPQLRLMLNLNNTDEGTPKRKVNIAAPSLSILNTKEWKHGLTLLEYIQNKKKITGIDSILPVLFGILKKCLDFEEQSAVEYTKQLLLTCLLHCCQKICPADSINLNKISKGTIDIELIVTCIRSTQNPQTHHHALMLLCHAAVMLPDQVLYHIMAIFTFIGSSVLRHDDAYSFQIITRIVETVIPILVKCKDTDDMELKDQEKRVIPVLRIFVDVVLDVPEHRRLPLFKKLLTTLGPEHFVWIFLSLVFEGHIMHGNEQNSSDITQRKLADREQPINRIDFARALTLEFSPMVVMQNCENLITYVISLPTDKDDNEDSNNVAANQTDIFSIESHSAKQLRHFKYTIITFINNVISSPQIIQQVNSVENKSLFGCFYKRIIMNILSYIQDVSKTADLSVGKPQAKYWKVMLHHCHEILDNIIIFLNVNMFIPIVQSLMCDKIPTVKRKSMEILNTKLQHQKSFFTDKSNLFTLLEPVLDIISTVNDKIRRGETRQEMEFNQQTALLSLKLLVRLLAPIDPTAFKPIMHLITDLMKSSLTGNLMASIVLCLAELCSNLKAHAIDFLPKFMPRLIKILKVQSDTDTPELILVSVITAVHKIVETIPQFLSPYLEKLLFQFAVLTAKWEAKNSSIVSKLTIIKNKISTTIAPRVLIPVISQCYNLLIKKKKFNAIGPAMNILAESFGGISGPEFASLQQELTAFFLSALQFRSDYADNVDMSLEQVDIIEGCVIKALVALVLKLSESSFRPLYFKIFDWSMRAPNNIIKDRAITFYRLSAHIADNLKGLFVLFAGHFIKNSAQLLDACNKTKTEQLFFDSEEKCIALVENIIKTLNAIFLYDCQNFVNKERFETIMQPLVDQLENEIVGQDALKIRAKTLLTPCIAQFAVATADDSLWKPLNYQILLKTRHNDAHIRLLGLECMSEMATKLGDSWLPLLPESVPFLAELLEDEVPSVEAATQKAVQTLEAVLGEPLQKYF